jgi:hypothetical protein
MTDTRRIHPEGTSAFEATVAMHFDLLMHGVPQRFAYWLMHSYLEAFAVRKRTLRGYWESLRVHF